MESSPAEATRHEAAGLAHVATVSFLSSRAVPSIGFWVALAGGLDVYTETYESLTGWTGFMPQGKTAALVLTAVSIVAWTVFASVVQVLVYRRGLTRWPQAPQATGARAAEELEPVAGRFDPRAVALAATIAFVVLVAGLHWALLVAVAAWLALASVAGGGDRSVVRTGVLLGLMLGAGVFVFTLIGGLGGDEALRRALRGMLLVLVATWLRASAGATGLREVSRRMLGRLTRLPSAREAAEVMDELGSGKQLGFAVRSVFAALRSTPLRPLPVTDAVLGWVVVESGRFRRAAPAPPLRLQAGTLDVVLVVGSLACGLTLFAG